MPLDSLRLVRNILLRSALIAYGVLLVGFAVTMLGWNFWLGLVSGWYHTSEAHYGETVLWFFAAAKFYAIFLLLVPGLAIHWTIKSATASRP